MVRQEYVETSVKLVNFHDLVVKTPAPNTQDRPSPWALTHPIEVA
jgi:hypothetical protein